MDTLNEKITILLELKLFDKYIIEKILTFLLDEITRDTKRLDEDTKSYILYPSFMDIKIINSFPQFDIYSIFYNVKMKYYIEKGYENVDNYFYKKNYIVYGMVIPNREIKKIFYDIEYNKYTLIHFIFYNVLKFYAKDKESIYNCGGSINNINFMYKGDYVDSYTHHKLFTSCKYITALYYKINYSQFDKLDNILRYLKNNDIQYVATYNFKYSTNYKACAYYELYDYKNLYGWYEEYTFNIMIDEFIEKCDMNNFIKNVYDNIDQHPYLEID